MARRRKRKGLERSRMHPKQAEGLTEGKHSLEEANQKFPAMPGGHESVVGYMQERNREVVPGMRQSKPKFRALPDDDSVWVDPATGAVRDGAVKVYDAEGIELLRTGRQCLVCDEPQPDPFPEKCDLCGYAMRAQQPGDFEREYEGWEDHAIGPKESLEDLIEERELAHLKREFDQKVLEGRSPMKGLRAT
jgi:hypothetical protein